MTRFEHFTTMLRKEIKFEYAIQIKPFDILHIGKLCRIKHTVPTLRAGKKSKAIVKCRCCTVLK